MAAVDVSVIVPAYRAARTLAACVESLLGQRFGGDFEVIVCASADEERELPRLSAHARLTYLTSAPRLSAARARNRAAERALGAYLAFTDADALAAPDWLERLVGASGGERCVAGSVRNGTPDSAVGTAEYLVEFFDLMPKRPARTAWHGATCNLLLPRQLWERFGPFPEDMDGGEDTLLTAELRRQDLFTFAPLAQVTHVNRTSLREVLAHQYQAGRFTADLVRRTPYYKGRLLVRHTALGPLATAGRVASLYARVAAWEPGLLPRAISLAPLVVLALLAWGWGLIAASARGGAVRGDRG